MSSHRLQTKKFLIIVGVDRPLAHVFATILTKSGAPAKGFPTFANFPQDMGGMRKAVEAIEVFICQSEPNWTMPETVILGLKSDLETLNSGGDIGGLQIH